MRKYISTHEQRVRTFSFLLNIIMVSALLIGNAAFPTSARAGGAIVVTTIADNTINDGYCSLREAITNANNNAATFVNCAPGGVGNDLINFDLSLGTATITLASALPNITDSAGLTIEGSNRMTISGNDLVRVFYVNAGALLTLQNISVTHGNSNYGGGLINEGTATITHSVFSNNHADYGGGALNNGGTMTITRSAFSGNSAVNDGGGVANVGTLTIANSTFSNNSANAGGGLINNSGTTTILNSTFSGNSATGSGGGVATWKGGATAPTTTIRNTILANSISGEDCWNHTVGSAILIGSNNIIETTSTCNSIATLTSDPNLGSLAGAPAYFPLNAGSPAIDAGNNAVCAAAPVSNTSQNGVPRPQGTHCEIGSFESPLTLTYRSTGSQDGWALESTETSNVGGTMNSIATVFNLGDATADKQYRAILSFNTASLPDTAVITKVTLKIRKQGLVGTNPFTTHGGLKVDIRKPYFGTSVGLLASDFQAAAGKSAIATFRTTPVSNWYKALLNATGRAYVNKTGTTQFRLRFQKDDNDDLGADYMKFFSGDYANTSLRPTLIIEYYVP